MPILLERWRIQNQQMAGTLSWLDQILGFPFRGFTGDKPVPPGRLQRQKLWPWRLSAEGGVGDRWLWPAEYARAVQGSSDLAAALVMMAVGLVLVWLLSFAAPGHNEVTETDE